jgi:DNA repair/transcription protein MET18/MMS19
MDVERVVRTHISSNDSVDEVPQDLLEGVYSRSFPNPQENGADDHLCYPQAVRNGQVGLLEIVRALGDYLTSTEDEVRVKG